jgi:hypothetical protein
MTDSIVEFVYALNLNLFAFKLESGYNVKVQSFKHSPQVVAEQYEPIFKKLTKHFPDLKTNPPELIKEEIDDNLSDLKADKKPKAKPKPETFDLLNNTDSKNRQVRLWSSDKLNGNGTKPLYRLLLYPQQITDSYALLLSLFRPQERGFDAVKVEEFADFYPRDFILKDDQADFLGQTLLVTAFLPDSITPSLDNIRPFVDDLRPELFGDEGPSTFYQSQEFLGSYMFEYGNPKSQRDRLLILLYIRETTSEKLKSIFWNLPELFLIYHKITHGFQVSRQIYSECEQLFREGIEMKFRQTISRHSEGKTLSNSDLESLKLHLKQLIAIAPEYALQLRNLEYNLNTLQIQIGNYDRLLEKMRSQANNPLDFFAEFSRKECQIFITQIQADLNYLKPAANLLEQTISTIRGIVEIEQVQEERKLQVVVTLVGLGIGVSGVTAATLPYYMKPLDPPPQLQLFPWNLSPHPITWAILGSLTVGFCAMIVVGGLIGFKSWIRRVFKKD